VEEPFILFKNIKRARTSSGLSQKELARRLGVSDKTVSAYETGRAIPPTLTLAKIAEITNVSLSNMIGEEADEKTEISKRLEKIEAHVANQKSHTQRSPRIKVDAFVGVVLLDKAGRIYLIKEEDKYHISLGRWNLPGGSVDGNESLSAAAKRETEEETGHEAEITELLGVYKCKKGENSWIYTVFKGILIHDGKKAVDPGVKEGRWFSKDEFLKLPQARIVHSDMKLVYKIALKNRGLAVKSVKYIDYDKQ